MKSKLFLPLLMVLVAVATMSYDAPKGWQKGSHGNYFVGTVPGAGRSGKSCATIRSCYPSNYCENSCNSNRYTPHGKRCRHCSSNDGLVYGDLHQNIDAGNYRGKRIRLTGWMRAENVSGTAGFWMQVGGHDCDRHSTQYAHDYCSMPCENADNMENRAIVGTEDWTKCAIVVDVPEGASNISYGARLYGAGQIWFENLKVEVVGRNIRTTGLPVGHNWRPTNLNFQAK